MAAPRRSSPPLPTARIPHLLGLLASTACAPATERPSTAPSGSASTPPATATAPSANELVAPARQRYPMARVPAGRYRLGCTPGQGAGCEGGVTEHDLPHDILVGIFEVTQGLYAEIGGTDPTPDPQCGVDCPVHFVSAAEAEAFADALSVREGLEPCGRRDVTAAASTCLGYRLPTEAE